MKGQPVVDIFKQLFCQDRTTEAEERVVALNPNTAMALYTCLVFELFLQERGGTSSSPTGHSAQSFCFQIFQPFKYRLSRNRKV